MNTPLKAPPVKNIREQMDTQNLLENELRGSFDFFHHFTNLNAASKGFGLTVDSSKNPYIASIASVGFALSAWVIAVERGYLTRQQAPPKKNIELV